MTPSDSRMYVGRLEHNRAVVFVVGTASLERLESPSDGFGWGAEAANEGIELARALLTDAAGSEPSPDVSRRFASQVLRRVPPDGFALPRDTVQAWLRRVVTV